MARRRKNRLTTTAEGIGSALGHLSGRVEALNRERHALAAHIQEVLASANRVLHDLGHSVDSVTQVFQRARKGGRPKGYKMSAATKAKLRASWKRRKAAAGKAVSAGGSGTKRKRVISPEHRAKIAAAQKARWAKKKG